MAYFTIRLPENALKIIGIECSVRLTGNIPVSFPPAPVAMIDSFGVVPTPAIGRLRLTHPGCSGIFYAATLKAHDAMIAYGDFTASDAFQPQSWTHGSRRLEDSISIPKQAKIISAIYQNINDAQHDLLVHVWYSTKEGGTQ